VTYMTEDEVLAGAKFYARASAQRAVNGVIPNWDDEADEANWLGTRPDVHEGMLDMVRGIIVACENKRHEEASWQRAKVMLDARAKAASDKE
jgi:hypothetical protein